MHSVPHDPGAEPEVIYVTLSFNRSEQRRRGRLGGLAAARRSDAAERASLASCAARERFADDDEARAFYQRIGRLGGLAKAERRRAADLTDISAGGEA